MFITGGLVGALLAMGCVQMPTEKQGISDMRSQISFKADDERVKSASILMDGLNMGTVGSYVEGVAALRVLSGSHVLTVMLGTQLIFEEKFYVGDGVNRTFILK
ncbi:hypothetical protein LP415_27590 [Polaromonas sp. P1(28)-8]|nr:hypothetical protein LP415_27590 [Polaromonas sp. P1(28)-8]